MDVDPQREKAAYDAIHKAVALAVNGPENERAYIDALAKRYSNDPKPNLRKLAIDYKNAMRDLVKRYPDDLDAATIYAESMMDLRPWTLWTLDGKPAEDTEEIVAVLQSVLKRDPQHIGANHYYIHALEASPHPEQALTSAQRMKTLVPNAGHLVHMPAHIYERTGDYAGAAKANEIAANVDREYLKTAGPAGAMYGMMYYSHNLQFLAMAASMEGNFAESKAAADQLVQNIRSGLKDMPYLESFVPMPIFILARFERWDDILTLPAPNSPLGMAAATWHYARGIAFSAKHDMTKARAERDALAAQIQKFPANTFFGYNPAAKVFAVSLEALEARIASAQGDRKGAISHWQRAVSAEDGLSYDEPVDWYYPTRESLGGELARDGQFAEAEKVFRADLERNPRNPRSLFGLSKVLEAQKKTADAESVRRQFEQAWKNADVKLRLEDL
jgi:tetratricopeptide (TPR) repeat protein